MRVEASPVYQRALENSQQPESDRKDPDAGTLRGTIPHSAKMSPQT